MNTELLHYNTRAPEEFPLFYDEEVGLSACWISACQIEARIDDDVDTDEEIMESALKTCDKDFQYANFKLNLLGWNNVTNNCDISHRVSNPEYYNRAGKFEAFNLRENSAIHPSI